MGSLQQPFQPGTVLRFGSLEFMSLDGSYDMILLPPPRDSDNGGRQPAAGGGINDVFPTWRKNNIRVCPVTSPADEGGGGATVAKQEAAPRRLSSESTAETSGIDLASETKTSAVSPQHANSKRTDDASTLAKDFWASPSYLRRRCSPPLT
jgi:hypothetical protein